jgi:AcrR family transcriptional regulator
MTAHLSVTRDKDERIPPRERILAAAGDLFYRHGIRAVGVEAIAESAGTNKMTLYRHFSSKDELVAEYLRQSAKAADACWDQLAQLHPGDEFAQLGSWFRQMADHVADCDQRGCALKRPACANRRCSRTNCSCSSRARASARKAAARMVSLAGSHAWART